MELSEIQKEAVNCFNGCYDVIASAGSGKTAVLVNRIVKLIEEHNVAPENILAITFSKKAKDNMVERLTKMIPEYAKFINIETFHSFGYRIIRKFSKEEFEILDVDWKKVKIIESIMCETYKIKEADGTEVSKAIHYISMQKNQMCQPNVKEKYGKIYKRYEDYKRAHQQLDFDDMLSKCFEILTNNKAALTYCQGKFKYILADEMQDTNAVQYEILRLIGSKYNNIFIVSDPLQAIYEWRGANNEFVLDFDKEWPDAKIIHLNKNYRSTEDIVSAANRFAKCIPEAGHAHYVESVADRGKIEEPHYNLYEDERTEAIEIAKKIKELADTGYKYKDIAILTRTNARLQYFETALYAAKIPYAVVGGLSFTDRKEIKIVLSYLRLVCDSNDSKAFEYVYNRPNRYLGTQFLREVKMAVRENGSSLLDVVGEVIKKNWRYQRAKSMCDTVEQIRKNHYKTVANMIADLRRILNLDSYISKGTSEDDDNKIENLNTLQNMASKYRDVKKFISFMDSFSKEKKTELDSVQLMTIHKSKGLEFPVVFVAGVNQGILPHAKNKNISEEKRLMYVAITRAEKILYVSSTQTYNEHDAERSEFIPILFSPYSDK